MYLNTNGLTSYVPFTTNITIAQPFYQQLPAQQTDKLTASNYLAPQTSNSSLIYSYYPSSNISDTIPVVPLGLTSASIIKRKKRYKKPPELRNVLPKNSLMILHELRHHVEYRFVNQHGPIHRPMFTMSVNIDENLFEGSGKTKKEARMAAADKAVKFLMDNPQFIQEKSTNKHKIDQNISGEVYVKKQKMLSNQDN
jgi:hypothetical protein